MNFKKISRVFLKYSVPLLGYAVMRLLWWSSRKKFHIKGALDAPQYLYVCWHGELLMSPQAYRSLFPKRSAKAMISHHFDGELIARTYHYLKIGAIRGSGRRGAKEVFLKALRALKKGDEILMTPDGPTGPRHHFYEGAVALAQKTKTPLCLITFECNHYWQLKSWDAFVIPKPFSRIDFFIETLVVEEEPLFVVSERVRQKMLAHTID
jgi:hypothetical protein